MEIDNRELDRHITGNYGEDYFRDWTMCDHCGDDIPSEEANDGTGDWEGSVLCNECFAQLCEI